MKAKKVLLSAICICFVFCFMTACGEKTPQTIDGFEKTMKSADFNVQDVTENTPSMNGLAKTVLVAHNGNYQIEFYQFKDIETAEGIYYGNKNNLDEKYSTRKNALELNSNNNNYYSFIADKEFCIVSRIDDTMIYCVVPEKHKDEVEGYFETLGYK